MSVGSRLQPWTGKDLQPSIKNVCECFFFFPNGKWGLLYINCWNSCTVHPIREIKLRPNIYGSECRSYTTYPSIRYFLHMTYALKLGLLGGGKVIVYLGTRNTVVVSRWCFVLGSVPESRICEFMETMTFLLQIQGLDEIRINSPGSLCNVAGWAHAEALMHRHLVKDYK